MKASLQKVVLVIIVMLLAAFSCYDDIFQPEDRMPDEITSDAIAVITRMAEGKATREYYTPTPRPTRTPRTAIPDVATLEPPPQVQAGSCAWVRTADSQNYPQGEVVKDMLAIPFDQDNSSGIETSFSHTPTEYDTQEFQTFHTFFVKKSYLPNESVNLVVVLDWLNVGDSLNSSLIKAGGVTMLTIGDFQLKAANMDINVRSNPSGSVSDSGQWIVPEGKVGDRFTMTQHISTGSFAVNVRWYYAYTCE